jgi:hypothetical protein
MNREDILHMARESGIKNDCDGIWCNADQLVRFAHLVAEAEREACAKVAQETVCSKHILTGYEVYGTKAAKAIRARGKE